MTMTTKIQPVVYASGAAQFPQTGFAPARAGAAPTDLLHAFSKAVIATANFVTRWYDRSRQRRQLVELDSRLLNDIGVSRAQALTEFDKPFWRS